MTLHIENLRKDFIGSHTRISSIIHTVYYILLSLHYHKNLATQLFVVIGKIQFLTIFLITPKTLRGETQSKKYLLLFWVVVFG